MPGVPLQNPVLPDLINLVAADCFIDTETAQILRIPLKCKYIPDLIETFSPLSSGPSTEEITPLEAVIQEH